MVVIRLSRGGTNKRPFYRVVVADKRAARDCRYLEHVGYFNPLAVGGEKRLELAKERIDHWLSKGAQPSERVAHLIKEFANPALLEKRVLRKQRSTARKAEKASAAAAPVAA